jgi:hypothetical protein
MFRGSLGTARIALVSGIGFSDANLKAMHGRQENETTINN